jgi:protease-4
MGSSVGLLLRTWRLRAVTLLIGNTGDGGFTMTVLSRQMLACIAIGVACAAGCSPPGGFKITTIPSDQTLKERIVDRHPGWVSDRIAIIDISGVLMNAYAPGLLSRGEHPVSLTVEKLRAAARDKRVKAVVLRINSPGGTVTASDTLYEEIKAFRKKTHKPVVAYFQDVAASGAYYLACAADEVMAHRTSVTGSIGIIMQTVSFSGTMSKLGIRADAIKSGRFKDAGSPLKRMSEEERAIFQEIVDDFYQQFLDVVAAARPALTREQVTTLADGRVYSAGQALDSGLIDRIGTLEDAIEAAKERAGIKAAHVVIYHRPLAWKPTLYAETPTRGVGMVNFININMANSWTRHPTFMYIWNGDH